MEWVMKAFQQHNISIFVLNADINVESPITATLRTSKKNGGIVKKVVVVLTLT